MKIKKVTATECIQSVDGQLMVMAAHRYCLGRRSYIVGAAIDWLDRWWQSFERNTQRVIIQDTIEAIRKGEAGSTMDAEGWSDFVGKKYKILCKEDKEWIDKQFPKFEAFVQAMTNSSVAKVEL